MPQNLIQIIIALFALFALSRVYLRFKEKKLSSLSFVFWLAVWVLGVWAVLDPDLTGKIANFLGIGRGVDAVIYASIAIIFYLIFRLYIKLEDTERHITELTKKIALNQVLNKKTSRPRRK